MKFFFVCSNSNETLSAKQKLIDAYGQNIMYGHTHDLQRHTKTVAGGTLSAWSLGCLKDIEADEDWLRGLLTNWNHAFAIIDWFKTLPLYIETEYIRVVHANWNDRAIQILDKYLDNNQRLKDDAYSHASAKESELYHAVETVLKGPEVTLPDGVSFSDNDGIVRTKARVNWWTPKESLLEEKLQLGSELKNEQNLKAMALDDGVNYDSKAKPLFVGHYWLKDEIPKPLSVNSVCVDYSIAKSGKLVAYQWQGEEVLNESQFVW